MMDYSSLETMMVQNGASPADAKAFIGEMKHKAEIVEFTSKLTTGIETPFGTLVGASSDYYHVSDAEKGTKISKKGFEYRLIANRDIKKGDTIVLGKCGSGERSAAGKWLANRVRTLNAEFERMVSGNTRNDGSEKLGE